MKKFLTRWLSYLSRYTYIRISDNFDLSINDGQNISIYDCRYCFFIRRRKGDDANIVALYLNTSVQMINKQ